MTLHETLKHELPEAMKSRDEVRLRTLRGLITMATNELVAKRKKPTEMLTDEEIIPVLKRAQNQRRESIDQFEKAGRTDLSAHEREELAVIEGFLPPVMSREEIEVVAKAKQAELGMTDKAKAGMLVGAVMKELAGKADGGDVKAVVDGLFA